MSWLPQEEKPPGGSSKEYLMHVLVITRKLAGLDAAAYRHSGIA